MNKRFTDSTVSRNEKINSQDAAQQTRLGLPGVFGSYRNEFFFNAVSASDYLPFMTPLNYMDRVIQWAQEFQARKHILTQREIETLTDDVYLNLLENEEDLP
jgi:hypothetical protein